MENRTHFFRTLVLGIFTLLASSTISAQNNTDEVFLATSTLNWMDYYIKISTIKRQNEFFDVGEYKCWVYVYPNPDHIKECRQWLSKNSNNNKYLSWQMGKNLYYTRCFKDQLAVYSAIDYSINNDIILNETADYPNYNDVIPESIGETIYNYVCKYVKEYKK